MQVGDFIARWSGREGGAERANYALFLSELTTALDLPPPEPADSGSGYRFEFGVRGDTGQPLRIDLYKRNCFILEAKQSRLSPDKGEALVQEDMFGPASGGHTPTPGRANRRPRWDADMRAAFNQAWDYANRLPPDHERPPFIVTCDVGRTFEFYSDFTGQGRAYRAFPDERRRVIALEDLAEREVQDRFHAVWEHPASLDPARRRAEATREVAGYLAQVSRALEERGEPAEEVATFLTRTLFSMFAEDVGLLPADSFKGLLQRCLESPASFAPQMSDLFRAMDEGQFSAGLGVMVRRFNGAFYKNRRAFALKREEIGALLAASAKDWRDVEPAIFGTLLEQALNPKDRSRLGAHYTPRPYVERLVQATVMDPLRADWDAVRAAAEVKEAAGDAAGAARELLAFHDALTKTRVLDPACGTGNFLYVTLELMKGLEAEVLDARSSLLTEAGEGLVGDDVLRGVDPRRFFGLELNPRAAAIAELVLWIGYLQASYRRDPSYSPRTPVLEDYATVNPAASRARPTDRCVDAVLQSDGLVTGGGGVAYPNPRRPAWPEAEFIVGNPPFIGKGSALREALGDVYVEALWIANPQMDHASDFVMYWWDRAADILTRKGSALRSFGLVTTNSITQVFQRRTVARWLSADNPNKQQLSLIFAVDDHPWTKATKDAAAVRIAMTTARVGSQEGALATVVHEAKLDTDQPEVDLDIVRGQINADLTVGADVTNSRELISNKGLCWNGVMLAAAGFVLSQAEADHLVSLDLGKSGRVVRRFLNGGDLLRRRPERRIIDFYGMGTNEARDETPAAYQHVKQVVKPQRDKARDAAFRENWLQFGRNRPDMRAALKDIGRFIATTETAKHRIFQFVEADILPDHMIVVTAIADPAHLAVLSSRVHTGWALRAGGWLGVGNDPRYSKSRCFDPFPFPDWTEAQHTALAEAGERLDGFRKARLAEHPDLTLTRLYNALEAHRAGRTPEHGMTPEAAADFARGSVVVLAELHAEIDALTLDAYGWPRELAKNGQTDALLARLVALNAERRAEEARGQVRWLRPAYQRPRFSKATVAGPDQAGDLIGPAPSAPADRAPWPREPRLQVLAIKGALAEAAPLTPVELAARFKGRAASAEVPRLLAVLQKGGQVRRGPDGAYALLRAA